MPGCAALHPRSAAAEPAAESAAPEGSRVAGESNMTSVELYELFQQQRRVLNAHPEWLNRQLSSESAPADEPAASPPIRKPAGEIRG